MLRLSDTTVINIQAFEQPSCLEDIVHILARWEKACAVNTYTTRLENWFSHIGSQ